MFRPVQVHVHVCQKYFIKIKNEWNMLPHIYHTSDLNFLSQKTVKKSLKVFESLKTPVVKICVIPTPTCHLQPVLCVCHSYRWCDVWYGAAAEGKLSEDQGSAAGERLPEQQSRQTEGQRGKTKIFRLWDSRDGQEQRSCSDGTLGEL